MKITNFKLNKNIAIFLSGFTLINVCMYKVYSDIIKLKPFQENHYKIYKVYEDELTQYGVVKDSYYLSQKINSDEYKSIVIKTPYFENSSGEIIRNNYLIPIDYYDHRQINYIKNNINNQKQIFSKDFIIETIEQINELKEPNIYKIDYLDKIPKENNYEITYLQRYDNDNEFAYIKNKERDFANNITYTSIAFLGNTCYTTAFITLNNKIKKKIKINEQ